MPMLLTKDTLDTLISNLSNIQQLLLKEKNLTNLRAYSSYVVDDWKQLNLVVDVIDSNVDTVVLFHLQEAIAQLLNCMVSLVASSMVRESLKGSLLGTAVKLEGNNVENIKKFWQENLEPQFEKINSSQQFSFFTNTPHESMKKKLKAEISKEDSLQAGELEQLISNLGADNVMHKILIDVYHRLSL